MNRAIASTVSVTAVYAWGRGDFGQLGLGDEHDRYHPTIVENLSHKDILHIAAGDYHTAFLTGDGELYTTGSNDSGQLGTNLQDLQFYPGRVAALDTYTICHVGCGQAHTVAVTDTGALASWGAPEFGQLGHKELAGTVDFVQPRIVKGSRELHFVRVACGAAHTLALTGSGDVYSFGQGGFGALGHGNNEDCNVPVLVEALWGLGIVQVACGETHSAALTTDGQVFTWGRGKYGQLGHGSTQFESQPVAVKSLMDQVIVQIVCGGDHMMAVNNEGALFAWGQGCWGQIGLGNRDDVLDPQQVFSLEGECIVQASAGARHSIAMTDGGKVYGWGHGEQGQLGISESAFQVFPALILDIEKFGGELLFVVAGGEHTMAVFQHKLDDFSALHCHRSYETNVEQSTNGHANIEVEIPLASDAATVGHPISDSNHCQSGSTKQNDLTEVEKHDSLTLSTGSQGMKEMDIHGAGLRRRNLPSLLTVLKILKETGVSSRLPHFIHDLEDTFSSARFLVLSFKLRHQDSVQKGNHQGEELMGPGLDILLLRDAYQGLLELYNPEILNKLGAAMLRLLEGLDKHMDHVPESRWIKVLLILLQSPLIGEKGAGDLVSTRLFAIFSRISLSAEEKIVDWLRVYPKDVFGGRFVRGLQRYISNRGNVLARSAAISYDRLHVGGASIPEEVVAAVKVLSIFYQVNKIEELIPYSDFYSSTISDNMNFQEHYEKWANAQSENINVIISFCQVPFVLHPEAKSKILQGEAAIQKQQRMETAVVEHLFGNSYSLPFLVLNIRRDLLIQDTLQQLSAHDDIDLKKQLKVVFQGEEGIDEGGVTKEFFQILVRDLFNVSYGMFVYNEEVRNIWFNKNSMESESEFRLVGIILGLAIYNGVILDVHFPMIVYKKLMGVTPKLCDLKDLQPQLHRSLLQLLDFEGDVSSTFCQTFQVEYDYFGELRTYDLIPGGGDVVVNNNNRKRYVNLYVKYLLEDSIKSQFAAFYNGFIKVCGSPAWSPALRPALGLFQPEELELLICGLPHFDFDALERVALYHGGYTIESRVVQWFWQLVRDMTLEEKKHLLFFTTGNDRSPIGGLSRLKFIIQRNSDDTYRLPTAHTCFNILMLPDYSTKEKLESKLKLAIENSTGFGLQ